MEPKGHPGAQRSLLGTLPPYAQRALRALWGIVFQESSQNIICLVFFQVLNSGALLAASFSVFLWTSSDLGDACGLHVDDPLHSKNNAGFAFKNTMRDLP